jgi:DNA polymerase III alpha subunit
MKIIKQVDKSELRNFMYKQFPSCANDAKLYETLNNHKAINVFQMSAGTASRVVDAVKPSNLEELTACNAMARPGTIDSLDSYIEGKSGVSKYRSKGINEVFGSTYGVCLFQEQIMRMVEALSPRRSKVVFTLKDGSTQEFFEDEKVKTNNGIKLAKDVTEEDLSFIISETSPSSTPLYSGNYARGLLKKLGKANKKQEDIDAWKVMVKDLEANAVKMGIPASEIKALVQDMETLANYSFNKSHALAYSMMAAWTLYLNVYFNKYYYPAVVEYAFDHDKETLETLKDMRKNGFQIHEPDLNTSKPRTFSSGKDLYIGLHNLKQVGAAADSVCARAPYANFSDFLSKNLEDSKVNKRVLTALVEYGCFDELEPTITRGQMISCFSKFWESKPAFKKLTADEAEKIKTDPVLRDKLVSALRNKINNIVEYWESIKHTAEENKFAVKDTRQFKKTLEEKYLGFNFFVSPFDAETIAFVNDKVALGKCVNDFSEARKFKYISKVVPVYISSVREYKDKNGNLMCFLSLEDRNGEETVVPIFASCYPFIQAKVAPDTLALMLMYNSDDSYHGGEQLMFGTKKWIEPEKCASFIIPLRRAV